MMTAHRIPRWRLLLWGAVFVIMLIPLIAMRFTREVKWDAADFAFAILLLGGAALAFEAAVRFTSKPLTRAVLGAGLLGGVALIWAQAAVGVF